MDEYIRVVIADDHFIFREGLKYVIQNDTTKVVAEASNGEELLIVLANAEADIVFIDVKMPKLDGIDATKLICEKYPSIKVIALSMYDNVEILNGMIDAGAKGFMLKSASLSDIEEAIRNVLEGNFYFSKELTMKNVICNNANSNHGIKLSDREKEILKLICEGFSTSEIAEKIFLSIYTIEGHRKSLLLKTEMKNTASLVSYAIKNNLIDL